MPPKKYVRKFPGKKPLRKKTTKPRIQRPIKSKKNYLDFTHVKIGSAKIKGNGIIQVNPTSNVNGASATIALKTNSIFNGYVLTNNFNRGSETTVVFNL